MHDQSIPSNGLPPAPGLDREEPELRHEEDIPDESPEETHDVPPVRPQAERDRSG